jgi:hypothetical protein
VTRCIFYTDKVIAVIPTFVLMHRKLLRLTAGVLLILFSYFSIGYHVIFLLARIEIKELAMEICKSNRETELKIFSYDEMKNLEWEDDSEFILNGDWYDVVSIKKDSGHYYIACHHDKGEQQLISSMKDHIDNHSQHTGNGSMKVKPSFPFVAILNEIQKKFFLDLPASSIISTVDFLITDDVSLALVSPPPENRA